MVQRIRQGLELLDQLAARYVVSTRVGQRRGRGLNGLKQVASTDDQAGQKNRVAVGCTAAINSSGNDRVFEKMCAVSERTRLFLPLLRIVSCSEPSANWFTRPII
jgi:hypothetical protein